MSELKSVAEWLLSCPNIVDAKPVTITVQRSNNAPFGGVWYRTEQTRVATERAVTDGPDKAGDKYYRDAIYILGESPKWLADSVCLQRGDIDWYIMCYITRNGLAEEFKFAHPFGANWIITPWDIAHGPCKGHKIDTGMPRQYERIPFDFEEVG